MTGLTTLPYMAGSLLRLRTVQYEELEGTSLPVGQLCKSQKNCQ